MRLHSLSMESFGPFAGKETIDFDAVGADGLFLLHGQTGAGKTTILDAIAFAFFGSAPGARSSGHKFLSNHAPFGSTPKVVVDATVRGKRFQITRTPEFERPSKRGGGTTKQNAKVTLVWLNPDGSQSAAEHLSRIPEVAGAVGQLLGMTKDQFCQVVLLPQGEFAQFLRASVEDREKLLENLFSTQRFGTVEDWFRLRRRNSGSALAAKRNELSVILGKLETVSNTDDGAPDSETSESEIREWASSIHRSMSELAATCIERDGKAAEAFASADKARHEVRALAERQNAYTSATADLAQLAAEKPKNDQLQAECDLAVAAAPLATPHKRLNEARGAFKQEVEDLSDAKRALADINGGENLANTMGSGWDATSEAAINGAINDWTTERGALKKLLEQADTLADYEREIAALATTLHKAEGNLAKRIQDTNEIPALRKNLTAAIAEATTAQSRIDSAQEDLEKHRVALDAARALPGLTKRLLRANEMHAEARSRHLDCRAKLVEIREARIAGMAGELARGLADGQPCVVCGAIEHPMPAAPSPDTVTDDDEKRAADDEQQALHQLEEATQQRDEISRERDTTAERAGSHTPEALEGLCAQKQQDLNELAAKADRLATLTAELAEVEAQLAASQQQLNAAQTEVATLQERRTNVIAQRDQIQSILDQARGDDDSVHSKSSRLSKLIAAATHLRTVGGRYAAAESRISDLAEHIEQLAASAGFDTAEAAASAVREPKWIAKANETLREVHDRGVRARTTIDDPIFASAAAKPPADLSAAEAAYTQAHAEAQAATQQRHRAEHALGQAESIIKDLDQYLKALGPAIAHHQRLSTLTEVIVGGGQNSRSMSLRSYVLAARLEEVADAASHRLRIMSGGRYEFQHSDSAGSHGKRGGLGLNIRDDYTGDVRPVNSLSGGETFMASLSLALGLADVVAAEAGGAMLDTLFIDEGFGTLDSDALDAVMGVLDELRAGGRVVGIVSHVDEMRQRIPSRIHAIKDRTGSRLATTLS
ncbi:SMC family ATPase [Hoyosella rhizosphaerae]|uniref:Nuclease SbcCD subunit C n=1 Tax=Hoyosella rhizosphaerae TaxID=1755582 RepID=A0A916UE47_9ACTN|nr:SMC family ATPase [Hoyosella rhizosphaerae]MBN4925648.1 SMC family ATPase [Hoyosella rhizosphaerae]GGC68992.1 nuclease SbcCD subunit C [Hoyosella rhizosphaerae]